MTDADHIARIDAITSNARTTWFALLGVLVFVGITLMGVEHVDFYGVNRATKLPLVDVEVPTKSFFFAAPVLTAAIFGYFHLYLIRLWDALGAAHHELNGQPMGDTIAPWLVSDAALHLRSLLRQEICATRRSMEGPAMALNLALAWAFGIGILFWLWVESMAARDIWITSSAAIALLVSIFAGGSSLAMLFIRMQAPPPREIIPLSYAAPAIVCLIVFIPLIGAYSFQRTMGPPDRLAKLDLFAENLVEKPLGWLPHDLARKDFLKVWCEREGAEDCNKLASEQQKEFDDEWKTRRDGALADLTKPDWHKKDTKPNLSRANLTRSFLSGVNLSGAQMAGAGLFRAQMEGADLREAQMQGAGLRGAQMAGADLRGAQMQGAVLFGAQMAGAELSFAQMEGADLREAQMAGADLSLAQMAGVVLFGAQMAGAELSFAQMAGAELSFAQMEGAVLFRAQMEGAVLFRAQMEGASLSFAQMEGANLNGAQMEGAVLSGAQMEGANLSFAQMEGANLSYSLLTGDKAKPNILLETNLSASTNNGGALRFVDFRPAIFDARTDFRNAFMDGSVQLPDGFADQMGGLCQRVEATLSDEDFFGHWRGWIEAADDVAWSFISIPEWLDVEPIPPADPDCTWKTGPMPGAE